MKVWELFTAASPPLGYDPATIPGWESPTAPEFAVLRLEPWRLRVLHIQRGEVLTWRDVEA